MPRNRFWSSEGDLIDEIKDRTDKRRRTDPGKKTIPNERPDAGYRGKAVLAYVANTATGDLAVGYSGSAGGMSRQGSVINSEQADRRLERLGPVGKAVGVDFSANGPADRPYCNCAEASALSIALSWGDRPRDLIVLPFSMDNKIMRLCPNCQEWVAKAFGGYCASERGRDFIKCDDDSGGPGKGGGGGSGASVLGKRGREITA